MGTTGLSDPEYIKYVGNVSTFLRGITSKDGDLLSNVDEIFETQAEINNTSLKHMPNDDHEEANRGNIAGQLS